jgi:hypothetical protein
MKIIINLAREILLLGSVRKSIMTPSETSSEKIFLPTLNYKHAHYYYTENSLIMKHIIKPFLVTFSFCYIGNISRLTSGVKVTNEATR